MKKLIIAEKPNLAQNIVDAIGSSKFKKADGYKESDSYIVSWAFGHLFGLVDIEDYLPKDVREEKPHWTLDGLPFCPTQFRYVLKRNPKTKQTDSGCRKQFQILKSLMERDDVDTIIHAGDADREGELIINNVLREAHNRKPVKRLWLPAQDEKSIREELTRMKDDREYINLNNEGQARTYIDWLYGVNLTRLATLKSNTLLRVGRVIVPIVKAIYDRDMEIEHFKPERYSVITSKAATNGVVIELTSKKKFFGETRVAQAEALSQQYNAQQAYVKDVKKERKVIGPGTLYSLSKLQGVLGKNYKMSPAESLALVQKLYENGYVTYPRTGTEYLATGDGVKTNDLLQILQGQGYDVTPKDGVKQIYDDSKIESHSAITPTSKLPNLDKLTEDEKKVYLTIFNRFVAVFCATPCEVYRTTIAISVGDLEDFNLKGDIYIQKGWKAFENVKTEDKELPPLSKGDVVLIDFKPDEKETKPPKHYTTATLNQYLKNPFREEKKQGSGDCEADIDGDEENLPEESKEAEDSDYKAIFEGLQLGTEATRGPIIDNAINSKYIQLKNNTYTILPGGIFMIESLKALGIGMDKYKTAELGKALKKVYRGEMSINDSVTVVMKEINETFQHAVNQSIKQASRGDVDAKDVLGKCPKCGSDVVETKMAYSCSNRECKFALWKSDRYFESIGKKMNKTVAKALLNKGKVKMTGLKSKKTGKEYDAVIVVDFSEQYPKYSMEFPARGNDKKKK